MMELVELVSNVGFPIAISIYFIVKVEKVIKNNTQALTEVAVQMERCPYDKPRK